MAVFGCCCKCLEGCASRLCACLYGICLLPIMVIFIVLGGVLFYALNVSDEEIDKQCPKIIEYAMDQYAADSLGGIQSFTGSGQDELVHVYDLTYINTFMCTDVCPCKSVPTQNEWLDMTAEELEAWPKQIDDPRIAKNLQFNFSGTYTSYL